MNLCFVIGMLSYNFFDQREPVCFYGGKMFSKKIKIFFVLNY